MSIATDPSPAIEQERVKRHGPPTEIDTLLEHLSASDIKLRVVADQLAYDCPAGALTESLRSQLKQNRAALISALGGPVINKNEHETRVPFLPHYVGLFEAIEQGDVNVEFTNATHWAVRFNGVLELPVFEQALHNLVRGHSILGARVEVLDGLPHFVRGNHQINLEIKDLTADPDESEKDIQAVVDEVVWRPFRIRADALFRPFLVRIAPQKQVIGFVVHHLVADAISVALIRDRLFKEYISILMRAPVNERPELDYWDYLLDMNRWLVGPGLRHRLRYWLQTLRGVRDLCPLVGSSADPNAEGTLRSHSRDLDTKLIDHLGRRADALGVTSFAICLAVAARVNAELSGRDDVVLLTMHHGRDRAELLRIVGSFQNQIPIRLHVPAVITPQDLIIRAHRTCMDAYRHQIPYGSILFEFWLAGGPPVFPEFSFVDERTSLHPGHASVELRELGFSQQPISEPCTRLPAHRRRFLKLEVLIGQARLSVQVSYLDSLYSVADAELMAAAFDRSLTQALAD